MPASTYPNALYALLQVESEALSDERGRTVLPLGPHLRHDGGLRLASLGLAAEHGTGTFAFREVGGVPTALSVSQRNVPDDLDALELYTRMRHRGRTIMVTSMEAYRPGDKTERLAFGTITWSVLPPFEKRPPRPGVEVPALADLCAVAGIEAVDGAAAIAASPADILGPGGILHAGALQTLAEHAALTAARAHAGAGSTAIVVDASFHFLRGGRKAPFVAHPRILAATAGRLIDIEIEIRDLDDRTCTLCTFRVALG